jgi:hypothetical protein
MWNMNEVTRIDCRSGRSYLVEFDDGTAAVLDFTAHLDGGPVFAPLKDIEFFRRARIEGGTIAWPNGADVAPETLCEECRRAAGGPDVAPRAQGLRRPAGSLSLLRAGEVRRALPRDDRRAPRERV